MARRSEQGNVLGFVLVGALLVALLLGGIYVARNVMTGGDTSPVTTTTPGEESPDEETPGQQKPDTGGELERALEEQSAADKKATGQQSTTNLPGTGPSDTTAAHKLPSTGPEEAVVPAFGVTLLAGTALAYARSRRHI